MSENTPNKSKSHYTSGDPWRMSLPSNMKSPELVLHPRKGCYVEFTDGNGDNVKIGIFNE